MWFMAVLSCSPLSCSLAHKVVVGPLGSEMINFDREEEVGRRRGLIA